MKYLQSPRSTIDEIFSLYGEDHFRELEKNYLQNLNFEDHPIGVVSTGGGAPAFFDNMDFMNFMEGLLAGQSTAIDCLKINGN